MRGFGALIVSITRGDKMSRPLVSVYDPSNSDTGIAQTTLPAVMTAPIRPDIVNYVHNLMSKNKRQAYGVNKLSGMQVRIFQVNYCRIYIYLLPVLIFYIF